MLKHASDLSTAFEFGGIWTGQSNAEPRGTYVAAAVADGSYVPEGTGLTFASLTIPSPVAAEQVLTCTDTLTASAWVGAKIRLGTTTTPLAGYGIVKANGVHDLRVIWTVQPTGTGVTAGYLVREDFKGAQLPSVRVLTPYLPFADTRRETDVPYPDPADTIANGGRRLLAPGFAVPASITTFRQLAVFLPLTWAEGINGFGLCELNDAQGLEAHAPASVSATTFGFAVSALSIPNDALIGGYARLEWEAAGVPKLSWAVITDNTGSAVTVAAWLGDGTPGAFGDIKRFTIWVAHYADNPNAYTPGFGFDYPNLFSSPYSLAASQSAADVTGTSTAVGASSLTDGAAAWEPNEHAGKRIVSGSSSGYVIRNTATVLTLEAAWTGGAPATGAYTISTASGAGPRIHNRARGAIPYAYGSAAAFGSAHAMAKQLAQELGKRVNLVTLAVSGTSLSEQTGLAVGFSGTCGWYDYQTCQSWNTGRTDGLAARLEELVTVMAPAAVTADGLGKSWRPLFMAMAQGESDTAYDALRLAYHRALPRFVEWLRGLVLDAGLSPYTDDARIPFAQLLLPTTPWEQYGTTYLFAPATTPLTVYYDEAGLVNNSIREFTTADGFSNFIETEGLERGPTEYVHFSGASEVTIGKRLADVLGDRIDFALGFGAPVLRDSIAPELKRLCNMALSRIGEGYRITSLTDGSEAAARCAELLPGVRNTLLQSRQWGFALRRTPLVPIIKPDSPLYDHFTYCYVVPAHALKLIAVLPPDPTGDYGQVLASQWDPAMPRVIGTPVPFAVEQSPVGGHRILFTDQEDAVLRYVEQVVDVSVYPPAFVQALSWALAAELAVSMVRGIAGDQLAQRCRATAGAYINLASSTDGDQRRVNLPHVPDHLANR